jgi:hypothetical protein
VGAIVLLDRHSKPEELENNTSYAEMHFSKLIKYCSTWVALIVLYQIINLIQNFWFINYLFNSKKLNICVI